MTREEQIEITSLAYGCVGSGIDFKAGAKWADANPNSGLIDLSQVWHDASEEPKKGEWILGEYQGGIYQTYLYGYVDCEWSSYAKVFSLIRWAYVNDLLSKGGKAWK